MFLLPTPYTYAPPVKRTVSGKHRREPKPTMIPKTNASESMNIFYVATNMFTFEVTVGIKFGRSVAVGDTLTKSLPP